MNALVREPVLILVGVAAVIDVCCRRIPNWLVFPFLLAGVLSACERHGLAGLANSLEAIALAALTFGILCWLGAMGMGDMKLFAAVGAWVGLAQLGAALLITAIAGGVLSLIWAARYGKTGESLSGASDLVFGLSRRRFRPHPTLRLAHPGANAMPYAPAILIGTMLSFFTS
jgi:prepilin peptidase CpaA